MKGKQFLALLVGVLISVSIGIWYQSTQTIAIGGVAGSNAQNTLWKLISGDLQPALTSWGLKIPSLSSSGDCLVTDASGNLSTSTCGSGGASDWNDSGSFLYPKEGDYVQAPYFISTSTTVFNRFLNIGTSYLRASSSAGVIVEANNGSDVADFGAGGGTNATFYGGVNIDGQTRVATSITGLLQGIAGVVSATTTGTFTETVTGLELSGTRALIGGSSILSLTSGYNVPLTASTTNWNTFYNTPSNRITAGNHIDWTSNTLDVVTTGDWTGTIDTFEGHAAVTLAGALDYITLAGQVITRGAIDLATDVTGALGIANGGLGAAFTDPNADRLMFWDDSAAAITGIVTLTGAAISGTTLTINDVTCTDCLSSTEIGDEYLFNNGDVGTGVYDFGGATSFEIVNGTGPTVDTTGEIALDTTDNQLLVATGTAARVIPTVTKLWGGTIASTSVDFATGGRIALPPHRDGVVITEFHCYVDGGTSKVLNIDTMAGGAQLDSVTCATTLTSDTVQSANYSLSAGALMALEFGATSGTVDYVTFSAWGYIKPE